MKATVDLYGWADSFFGNKIYFPLQIAMDEVIGNCDFYFQVESKVLAVNKPRLIKVIASRCSSCGFDKIGTYITIDTYEFSFIVRQYTKSLVYDEVVKTLKRKDYKHEQIKMVELIEEP